MGEVVEPDRFREGLPVAQAPGVLCEPRWLVFREGMTPVRFSTIKDAEAERERLKSQPGARERGAIEIYQLHSADHPRDAWEKRFPERKGDA